MDTTLCSVKLEILLTLTLRNQSKLENLEGPQLLEKPQQLLACNYSTLPKIVW